MTAQNDIRAGLPVGTMLGGKFRVERFLGAGAMGAVYEVVDCEGRRWAAKTLLQGADRANAPDTVARFMREGGTGSFSSEHVVSVFDAAIDQTLGMPFFVMPLLNGFDLEMLVDRVGALHPTIAARIALQACRGLQEAHARGIVHRDIKPSNIFLHHGADGRVTVKVCDFGIAKWTFARDEITSTGTILGTPLYMSPEQASNSKKVDPRADVWGLAQSLYHALAGVPAFERVGSLALLLLAIVKGQVPPLQDRAPWVHPLLAATVHGALIPDLAKRCPDIGAFATALTAFTDSSDELRDDMLGPISPELRAYVAPRAPTVASWSGLSDAPSSEAAPSYHAERDPLVGTYLSDRYYLDRLIGKGGMGAIYAGRTRDGYDVAVKVILESPHGRRPEVMRRFVREAKVLTSIRSRHVVRVLDVDSDTARQIPYIVMELLSGNDLDNLVKKWGALEPGPALRLFIQAARGLAAAHKLGIVHRDIKPANIFLHELPAGRVVPKVCDFGIAKRTAIGPGEESTVELTRTGGVIGSPVYMSPEQAKSAKHVDVRTDLWSLGISLWETLSGHRPWEECSSVGELILAICTKPVTPLQSVAPWIPAEIAAIVHRCLAQEPVDRIGSVEELIEALEPHALKTEALTRHMLLPVSAENRALVASTVASAASQLPEGTLIGQTNTLAGSGSSKRGIWIAVAGAAAALAVGGTVLGVRMTRKPLEAQPVAVAITSAAATTSSAAPSTSAWVMVKPPDAKVMVGGRQREVSDGGVLLQGQPGDSFHLVVESGDGRIEETVVLTNDGGAMPCVVEVTAAPTASAVKARPIGAGGKVRATPKEEKEPKDKAATAPTPSVPPGIKAAENW
jgi:serine/threonine protein kinase